jgi:hypothetical protein
MSGGGELLLMHEGGYLYIGIRAKPEPVTSICIDQGERVSILHSSAAIGTAIYKQGDAVWEMIQGFEWCCRETTDSPQAQESRSEHLELNGWMASNGRMGTPEDVEFKIYMPEGQLRLAVTSIGAPDYEEIAWWPVEMADDCRNPQNYPWIDPGTGAVFGRKLDGAHGLNGLIYAAKKQGICLYHPRGSLVSLPSCGFP